VTPNRKRIPGEKNPVGDRGEVDQVANAARSSQMLGLSTGTGVSAGLLQLFTARRARKAKKDAIAAWEARQRGRSLD
jgi:hypothetical protein